MALTMIKDCIFTLYRINSSQYSSNYYNVIIKLKSVSDTSEFFVSFYFSSFDYMYFCLNKLLKVYGISRVDDLFKGEYSAKLKYEEVFNSPPNFKALFISENETWPIENACGYFLIDYYEEATF